jgi:hypothetical protein
LGPYDYPPFQVTTYLLCEGICLRIINSETLGVFIQPYCLGKQARL